MTDARIFADLKADHARQRALLAYIGDTRGAGEERQALFEELRLEIAAHAAAEEESLYAAMLADPELRDDARHSVSEHKEVDDLFGELAGLEFGGTAWERVFGELRHRYTHHIDEEEEEMFPAAAKGLSTAETARLATVFERRKPRELVRAEEAEPGDDRE
ncbi:MAG: hemerythrin domain-containing protein [Sphingomonas sp.]